MLILQLIDSVVMSSCCCCWVTSVVSNSVQPHRRQPIRLPYPWDSPGQNTGVGCHFLLQCMKVKSESEVAQSCLTLRPHGLQPTRLLHPWDFPGKSTGVGCHCYILPNFLLAGYIHFWETGAEVSNYDSKFIYFSSKVYQFFCYR